MPIRIIMFMSWLASSVKEVHIQCLIIGCTYSSEFSVMLVILPLFWVWYLAVTQDRKSCEKQDPFICSSG